MASLLYAAVVLVHILYIGNLFYTNFKTYGCRSAQSEAIQSLKEIYRLQQAYYQTHHSYAQDLETLQFKPEKYSRYEYSLDSQEEFGITIELPPDGFLAFAEQIRGMSSDLWLMDHRKRLMNVKDICLGKRTDPNEVLRICEDGAVCIPADNSGKFYIYIVVATVVFAITETIYNRDRKIFGSM